MKKKENIPWASDMTVMNIFTKSNPNLHSHSVPHSFPTTLIIFFRSNSILFFKILFLTSFLTFLTFRLSVSICFLSLRFFPFLHFYLFLFLCLLSISMTPVPLPVVLATSFSPVPSTTASMVILFSLSHALSPAGFS